ncbi:type II toxin-antitoxin system antitoxin HipB [Escherichia coli]|nr:type II toxin-antitoxin system antitoxin HipB [Escherichia coli]
MMSFQKIYSPMQLANAMKLVRQQNGWTQSELAKKIGIKQATISNFENNPNNTSLTTFFKMLASRYARPLSLSLPLQRRNITSDAVFKFFDNLLPDSPIVRDRIVKRYHAKSRQPFDLRRRLRCSE